MLAKTMIKFISTLRLMRVLRYTLIACALTSVPASAGAADLHHHELRIAVADENEQTKRVVEALQKKYPGAIVAADGAPVANKRKKPIVIAVGPSALRNHLKKDADGPVIAVFTSSQTYRAILDETSRTRAAGITAIYADPAPSDQLRLISLIYKRRVPIAVLLSDKTAHFAHQLNQAAARSNIDLSIEHVAPGDNVNRVLGRLGAVTAILALPDSVIYNSDSIRNILVTSYRSNQALIGFSASMVRAGALATTYASVDDIIAQLSEMLEEFDGSGKLPEAQFPRYFSVIVNDNVARSLDIVIDDSVRTLSRKPGAK